jgi:hypothetical protein
MKYLKRRFVWAGALALAVGVTCLVQTRGGTIMIITRYQQDLTWVGEDGDPNDGSPDERYKAAGQCSPGDVAMAELLGDYGYTTRVIISQEVFEGKVNPCTTSAADPEAYLHPINPDFDVSLVIQSGSGSSSYAPPMLGRGVPIMSGEHACLSDRAKPGSIFMYTNGGQSDDCYGPPNGGDASQYMYVLQPDHPIMKGIPLDAQGRVKLIRDAYPEESAHIPTGGFPNWEYDYPVQYVANAAPATTVLGVVDNHRDRACFAVADIGKLLSNGETNQVRLVHYFVCEGGGNDSRRCFNALTDLGRVLFVRAAKWAMGETLPPYKSLGIVDVSLVGAHKMKLSWQGSADKNYKILGTANLLGPADLSNWETIVQDIHGTDGVVSRTLDVSGAAQVAFLRVAPMP